MAVVAMAAAFMVVFMVAMGTRDAMDFMGGPITGVLGVTPITGDTIILPSTVMKVMGEHTAGDTDKLSHSSHCHKSWRCQGICGPGLRGALIEIGRAKIICFINPSRFTGR